MKNQLNKKSKFVVFTALVALMASQSGFIAGIATLWCGAGIPMIIAGGLGMAASLPLTVSNDSGIGAFGVVLFFSSAVLDEKTPAHIAALNEVPVTQEQASQMGVSQEDIQNYNDALNSTKIQDAYNTLRTQAIKSLKAWGVANNQDTSDLGLAGPTIMPTQAVADFAAYTSISTADAKILLFKAFGTKTVD